MFSYAKWLELPFETRVKLAQVFHVNKTSAVEVSSNQIVRDGYNVRDLENALSTEAMQEYLGAVDGGDDMPEVMY